MPLLISSFPLLSSSIGTTETKCDRIRTLRIRRCVKKKGEGEREREEREKGSNARFGTVTLFTSALLSSPAHNVLPGKQRPRVYHSRLLRQRLCFPLSLRVNRRIERDGEGERRREKREWRQALTFRFQAVGVRHHRFGSSSSPPVDRLLTKQSHERQQYGPGETLTAAAAIDQRVEADHCRLARRRHIRVQTVGLAERNRNSSLPDDSHSS